MFPLRSKAERAWVLAGSLGPVGFLPASGTTTVALVGVPLFWCSRGLSLPLYLAGVIGFTLASVWVHQRGDEILGTKDSRVLVWDELVGFLIAVTAVPFTWQAALLAFVVERTFDIVKIWPAGWVERNWPGGWGVVGDDVVAGLYTLAFLHMVIAAFPRLLV